MMSPEKAAILLKRQQNAKTQLSLVSNLYREVAKLGRPFDTQVNGASAKTATAGDMCDVFDSTVMASSRIWAAGCIDWMTPAERPWFRFDPPRGLEDNEAVKRHCSEATEVLQEGLAKSNFYGEQYQTNRNDGLFGTSAIYVDEGTDSLFRFDSWAAGDYQILHNAEKRVDTVFRELKLTARQAEQKFGKDKLPETVRDCLNGDGKSDKEDVYIHCVMPREDADREYGKIDGANMPIASIYIHESSKAVVREEGHWEMPVAVHRHELWANSVYGMAPAWEALSDGRQLNDLQMNLDILAELAVGPRIIAPSKLKGELDLRKHGVTYTDDMNNKPEMWLPAGDYRMGQDRVRERQEAVRRAFHVELFQMFANLPPGKEMTAVEVMARQSDKTSAFSPIHGRKTNEQTNPMLMRCYAIALRTGAISPPPPEMMIVGPSGQWEAINPKIELTSRMALAIKALGNQSLLQTLGALEGIFTQFPDQLDHFDFDTIVPEFARNAGVPERWRREEIEIDRMRKQRAELQAAEQEQLQAAQQVEDAAKLAQAGLVGEQA